MTEKEISEVLVFLRQGVGSIELVAAELAQLRKTVQEFCEELIQQRERFADLLEGEKEGK